MFVVFIELINVKKKKKWGNLLPMKNKTQILKSVVACFSIFNTHSISNFYPTSEVDFDQFDVKNSISTMFLSFSDESFETG